MKIARVEFSLHTVSQNSLLSPAPAGMFHGMVVLSCWIISSAGFATASSSLGQG